MTTSEMLARRDALLGVGTTIFYDDPVHIVRGEGVYLFDADGKRYVDMYNNVPCVGHAHPRVVAAMQAQAATLNVHSRYLHEGVLDYAQRLLDLHTASIESVVFTCSGTEATEVALLMARAATGGEGIICTDATYHGNSTEVRKMSRARLGNEPVDRRFKAVPFPELYRPIEPGRTPSELTERYLAEVEAAIEGFAADGIRFAGMIVCSLLANEGLPDIPPQYMSRAAKLVRAAGGVFIADEVQAGFCRSGQWWGYGASGFEPDIVTMGKPMGNGLPLAGTAASGELVAAFRDRTRYFNTFASSPLQAAVGTAVIDVIEDEGLADNVSSTGAYLKNALDAMQPGFDAIGDVRGTGLFLGVEWVSDPRARTADERGAVEVVNRLKRKGFLVSNAGVYRNIIKIRPPLVFSREHADAFLSAFDETVREMHARR